MDKTQQKPNLAETMGASDLMLRELGQLIEQAEIESNKIDKMYETALDLMIKIAGSPKNVAESAGVGVHAIYMAQSRGGRAAKPIIAKVAQNWAKWLGQKNA